VAAEDAELVETAACRMYLRVARPTLLRDDRRSVPVEAGVYQVIRAQPTAS